MPIPSDAQSWIAIGLGSGVVSALVTSGISILRDRNARKRAVVHSTLRLATILEEFALACARLDREINMHVAQHGEGWSDFKLPVLPQYPEAIDWKVLPHDTTAVVLGLPNDVSMADQSIYEAWDNGGEGSALAELSVQAGLCGLKALDTASELRHKHGLQAFSLSLSDWNIRANLEHSALRRQEYLAKRKSSGTEVSSQAP